jgi:CDP-2,3-bis-(O-geranylgeranyl)-sn-glycerol synthase
MNDLSFLLYQIFNALYYIFPAFCANGAPVLFGGGRPIDGGKMFFDGKPVFGSHKTIRGFASGVIIGSIVGWAQEFLAPNVGLPRGSVLLGFSLSLGALVGDLMGSFFKRRINLKPGAAFPIADQLDFVLSALFFGLWIVPLSINDVFIIVVLTGPIHLIINFLAYLLHLKDNPW